MSTFRYLISCEHASNAIPRDSQKYFQSQDARDALNSPWAYDVGAARVARGLAPKLNVQPILGKHSRLLADLNRSPGHPQVFSRFTKGLSREQKQKILDQHHAPHWDHVENQVQQGLADGGRVVHLAIHSFMPVLHGQVRDADVGLLYDPGRPWERDLAQMFKAGLQTFLPGLRVRMNYPYKGVSDGLPTALRKKFSDEVYAGFEIEINQALLTDESRMSIETLIEGLFETVLSAQNWGPQPPSL